jgi:hypothetical protein
MATGTSKLVSKTIEYLKREGLVKSLSRGVRLLSRKAPKRDVRSEYGFVQGDPVGLPPDMTTLDPMTINWVMPPFGRGSGAIRTYAALSTCSRNAGFAVASWCGPTPGLAPPTA